MFFDPFKKKKKEKELILVKPIKKSKYLKNLEKQKYEGLKLIEVEKAELLIDRILKRERFVRDYTIFSHYNHNNKNNENSDNNERRTKDPNINGLHKNNKSQLNHRLKINKSIFQKDNIPKIPKETFITRSVEKKKILPFIGNEIINSSSPNENKNGF